MKATPDSLVETLAAQWDGCEYDAPGGLIDIGDAIRRAGLPLAAILRAEVERLAQSAPLAQQREYPPLPVKECAAIWPAILDWYGESPGADTYEKSHAVDQAITAAMRAYVDAALAAAQVDQPKRVTADAVRMLTNDERKEVMDRRMNDYDGTENIAVMLQRAFCRVNAGRVIPADGEVRG